MKKLEPVIGITLLFVLCLPNLTTQVNYAGKTITRMPLVPSHTFLRADTGSVLGASTSLLTIGTQAFDLFQSNTSSAQKRIPISMERLSKNVLQLNEDVNFDVINPDNEPFITTVTDAGGQSVRVPITESNNGATTTVEIESSNAIKPGLYTIQISDQDGNSASQNFSWGTLSLNTDKALYKPNDTANISMSVLDNLGNIVCDASIRLQISNQDQSSNDILSTDATGEKQIAASKQCQLHDVSMQSDYETQYQFGKAGTYTLQMTAVIGENTQTLTKTVQVTDKTPFDIKRISATRTYASHNYPMIFQIKANQDFSGTVIETVPESFTITPITQAGVTSYADMQMVYIDSTKDPSYALDGLFQGNNQLLMPFMGNYPVTQGFGAQVTDPTLEAFYTQYGLAGHDGVDFGLPIGTPLYAVDDGDVIWSGPGGYGTMVTIQHSWGETYYGHMSGISVVVGDHVTKGQLIGYSGQSGEATGPHLHFGVKPNNPDMQNGYYGKIDPLPYLLFGNNSQNQKDGKSLSMSNEFGVLGASTSANSDQTATPDAVVSSIPETISPTDQESTPTVGQQEQVTQAPTPNQAVAPQSMQITPQTGGNKLQPIASSSAQSNLANQIYTDEMLANNAQTQKVKVISWKVNLKKGESTTLGYSFQSPTVEAKSYLLGPLRFYLSNSDTVIYQEPRQWQITTDTIGGEWFGDNESNKNSTSSLWQFRKKIIIDHTRVASTLSHFPLFVKILGDKDLLQNVSQNGNDIVFTDASGKNVIPFEIQSYTNGSLDAWVDVPSLSDSADTILYMYYGNAAPDKLYADNENSFIREIALGELAQETNLASDSAITLLNNFDDEVTSSSAVTPAWINTMSSYQLSPQSFYIFGTDEIHNNIPSYASIVKNNYGDNNIKQIEPLAL